MLRKAPKYRGAGCARRGGTPRSEMNMANNALFATVAALSGDPARAAMLQALMDGRALTASELARVAGITPQTASGHLNRMTGTGLLSVEKQGRHRYHRLAAPSVARMLESIMQVASELEPAGRKLSIGPKDAALRRARTCYDHLAGQLGVSIADGLMRDGYVELAGDAGIVTDAGIARLAAIGMDVRKILERRTGSLPALSGLERAPTPPRRHARRADLRAQHATRMDPPIARNPCRAAHTGGRARLS